MAPRSRLPLIEIPHSCVRSRRRAQTLGARTLETHRGDAQMFLLRESRLFDVIFLDPPFDADPWAALLPAAAARLATGGVIYAEARSAVSGAGLAISHRDKAGQVHYHLLRRAPSD